MTNPSFANFLAGSISLDQLNFPDPHLSNTHAIPATVPGTPEARYPIVDEPSPLIGWPS
jgi:hypothetical protein